MMENNFDTAKLIKGIEKIWLSYSDDLKSFNREVCKFLRDSFSETDDTFLWCSTIYYSYGDEAQGSEENLTNEGKYSEKDVGDRADLAFKWYDAKKSACIASSFLQKAFRNREPEAGRLLITTASKCCYEDETLDVFYINALVEGIQKIYEELSVSYRIVHPETLYDRCRRNSDVQQALKTIFQQAPTILHSTDERELQGHLYFFILLVLYEYHLLNKESKLYYYYIPCFAGLRDAYGGFVFASSSELQAKRLYDMISLTNSWSGYMQILDFSTAKSRKVIMAPYHEASHLADILLDVARALKDCTDSSLQDILSEAQFWGQYGRELFGYFKSKFKRNQGFLERGIRSILEECYENARDWTLKELAREKDDSKLQDFLQTHDSWLRSIKPKLDAIGEEQSIDNTVPLRIVAIVLCQNMFEHGIRALAKEGFKESDTWFSSSIQKDKDDEYVLSLLATNPVSIEAENQLHPRLYLFLRYLRDAHIGIDDPLKKYGNLMILKYVCDEEEFIIRLPKHEEVISQRQLTISVDIQFSRLIEGAVDNE